MIELIKPVWAPALMGPVEANLASITFDMQPRTRSMIMIVGIAATLAKPLTTFT
jgi:hypothetical protein